MARAYACKPRAHVLGPEGAPGTQDESQNWFVNRRVRRCRTFQPSVWGLDSQPPQERELEAVAFAMMYP